MMAWERDRRLKEKLNYLQELEKVKNFDWDDWRKRFLKHHNNKKSRVTDLFRKLDEDADGKLVICLCLSAVCLHWFVCV